MPDIEWTKDDITRLAAHPDYPWRFVPWATYKADAKVLPVENTSNTPNEANWFWNQNTNHEGASTLLTNSPYAGWNVVSFVMQVKTNLDEHNIRDDDLVVFIYNDPRFCQTPRWKTCSNNNDVSCWAQVFGCSETHNRNGTRLKLLDPSGDFVALSDQVNYPATNPGPHQCNAKRDKKAWKPDWSDWRWDSTLWVHPVHRHLVKLSKGSYRRVYTGTGNNTVRQSNIIRLHDKYLLFKTDYNLEQGFNTAQPIRLRDILNFSISKTDSQIPLHDGSTYGMDYPYPHTQENAVLAYSQHYCGTEAGLSDKRCQCFRKPPPGVDEEKLKYYGWSRQCHDSVCKVEGYKLNAWANEECKENKIQVCNQSLEARDNTDAKIQASQVQQCIMQIQSDGKTASTQTNAPPVPTAGAPPPPPPAAPAAPDELDKTRRKWGAWARANQTQFWAIVCALVVLIVLIASD